jgi:serine protease Do
VVLASAAVIAPFTTVWGQSREEARRLRRNNVVKVVEQTRDSVVSISSTQTVRVRRPSLFGMYFDEIFAYPETTSGSGFVIHEDGYIVTNHHVVARSADHRVKFADGREYEATPISSDPAHDLAILKIEPDEPLAPLELGRSDDIMVGEDVIAIGNPFGLENTVTRGVVSALHRRLEFSPDLAYEDLIQTDASINPGNSGGPLLNVLGELIGINTAIRPEAENVGFAIPVDHLRALLPDMLDITQLKRIEFGMRVAGDKAEVVSIEDESPAATAGLRAGDVVTEVDGKPVARDVDFYIAMLDHRPGQTVSMKYQREDKEREARIKLTAVPELDAGTIAWEKLGLRLEELSAAASRKFGLRRNAGLVVTEIDEQGPARRSSIRVGDLLIYLGRYRAWPLDNVALLLKELHTNDPVDATILRFYTDGSVDRTSQRLHVR